MKYAEIKSELKALLEKIMDRYPDPEEERMSGWLSSPGLRTPT